LDANVAGSGSTGDLLSHCNRQPRLAERRHRQRTAMTETFVKDASTPTPQGRGVRSTLPSAFLARFQNGALCDLSRPTRYARGPRRQEKIHRCRSRREGLIFWYLPDLHRCNTSTTATKGQLAAGARPHHHRRPIILTWPLWVPWAGDRLRSPLSTSRRISSPPRERQGPRAPTFRDGLANRLLALSVLASAKSGRWTHHQL